MRKRGETLTNNLVGLIIAVAFIIILILLISNYLEPGYDMNEKYSKVQLDMVKDKITQLEKTGETQEHSIIAIPEKSKHFLVYFGDKHYMGKDDVKGLERQEITFSYPRNKDENSLCECYFRWNIATSEINPICKYCTSLDNPIDDFKVLELEQGTFFTITKTSTGGTTINEIK